MLPAPASAVTFSLAGGATGQLLVWSWEYGPPGNTCHAIPFGCAYTGSQNGTLPYAQWFQPPIKTGGMLVWNAGPGSLEVVGMTIGSYWASNRPGEWGRAWTSIDAQFTPLTFQVEAEPGDPLFTNLRIEPYLLGTVYQYANPGTTADADFQMK